MLTSGSHPFATIEAEEAYIEHKCKNGEQADLALHDAQWNDACARQNHMQELSEEYDIDLDIVVSLADMLGPNEDHDGLISALDDLTDFPGFSWEDLTDF
jgi:hypothetical protein